MREEHITKYKCSVCDTILPINPDKTKFECIGAHNLTSVISIEPCYQCKAKQDEFKKHFEALVKVCKDTNPQ